MRPSIFIFIDSKQWLKESRRECRQEQPGYGAAACHPGGRRFGSRRSRQFPLCIAKISRCLSRREGRRPQVRIRRSPSLAPRPHRNGAKNLAIENGRERHPTTLWIVQQLREAFPPIRLPASSFSIGTPSPPHSKRPYTVLAIQRASPFFP